MADPLHKDDERRTIKSIVNSLFGIMLPQFDNFPNDYVVIDVETTGVKHHKPGTEHFNGDLITELGYCHVKDGKAIDNTGFILNWFSVPKISHEALEARLLETKKYVETDADGLSTGRTYHMSADKMKAEGSDPAHTLNTFADMLIAARDNGLFYLSHNGYNFDIPFIESHLKYWASNDFSFCRNCMFDTGMVSKASQVHLLPWPDEDILAWSKRVYTTRLKGVRWSLDRDLVPRYDLDKRYNLDVSQAHTAGYDCLVTHYLFETFKEIAKSDL